MSGQKTLPDTHSAISSQEEASGASQLDLQGGQTIDLFGRAPALASRSRSRVKEPEPMIQGTCGRTSSDLSPSANLQRYLANRLRAALDVDGSPECSLTWKTWDMPQREPICALRASARRIFGKDYTGSAWPTPKASDGEGGRTTKTRGGGNSHLPIHVREAATWPTPTTRDGKDGSFCPNVPTNSLLGREVWNGDGEQTEKRGALNPIFVFWLMGCPDAWVCSVLEATRSWRPSRRKS